MANVPKKANQIFKSAKENLKNKGNNCERGGGVQKNVTTRHMGGNKPTGSKIFKKYVTYYLLERPLSTSAHILLLLTIE